MNEYPEVLSKIDSEIDALEDKKEAIKAGIFKEASKDWYKMLSINFDSSSGKTEQYMTFCKVFRKQFKKLLADNFDLKGIDGWNSNAHFSQSGFFEVNSDGSFVCPDGRGRIFYFSIEDLRWSPTFMIRRAKDFKDYTGGSNDYLNVENFESFMTGLRRVVKWAKL
tara:strand:- start:138 stop:635 length:498 start_codon:yes stop_codon:yes gene_type:complete